MFKDPIKVQWDRMEKEERNFLVRNKLKKVSKLDSFLNEKVPDKLQSTLNKAFSKSFEIVFKKGTGVIEKSYNKEEIELKHKVNKYAFSLKPDSRRLKAFSNDATKTEALNVLISGTKGVGLGLLGIGLPDIPVFIAMVLKGIYEISLKYGFEYDSITERYFILNIICSSLSYGDKIIDSNDVINEFIDDPKLPEIYSEQAQIDKVSDVLATELLCMKFLQGLPIVGVVGGVSDAVFMKKIMEFAKLKYKRRFLTKHLKEIKGPLH